MLTALVLRKRNTSTCVALSLMVVLVMAVFAAVASDASAAVVVLSRDSSLQTSGAGQDTLFSDQAQFGGAGRFNDSVAGEEGSPPDGPFARGSASQDTTVTFVDGPGPFTGSGKLFADAFAQFADEPQSVNNATADSILEIKFQVNGADAEPFSISGAFDALDLFPGATVVLRDMAAANDAPALFLAANDSQSVTELTFSSGVIMLQPGNSYLLALHAAAGSSGTGPGGVEPFGQSSGLSFELSVGEAVTPPPPTAIPLPAGVWAGMIGLTVAAGAVRKSRRR